MNDARIRQLAEEVLTQLAGPKDPVASDLEARVAALERAFHALTASPPASTGVAAVARPVVALALHPSHGLLAVSGASSDGRCVLEPDRPCVESGQCRALGH
jgi:hypothetical protein